MSSAQERAEAERDVIVHVRAHVIDITNAHGLAYKVQLPADPKEYMSPEGRQVWVEPGEFVEAAPVATGVAESMALFAHADPGQGSPLTDADLERATHWDQPPPRPNASRPVWEMVIEDMRERDHVGRARYGTPLQLDNGRDHLADAYAEALDLVVYLRAELERRKGKPGCATCTTLGALCYPHWAEAGSPR